MRRRAKPAKAKSKAKPPVGRKPRKTEGAREVLRPISQSPIGARAVFEGIARRAARLCRAVMSLVALREGDELHLVAVFVEPQSRGDFGWQASYPRPLDRTGIFARVIRERVTFEAKDTERDPRLSAGAVAAARRGQYRRFLAVPMLREGEAVGVVAIAGAEPGRFPAAQIALVETFADQAVIAIENARLFTELQSRNRDLTEAREQQTATSEILRAISRSPADVQPVFETIVARGRRLSEATQCALVGYDGETLTLLATDSFTAEGQEAMRLAFPYRANRSGTAGRAVLDRTMVHIPDVIQDTEYAFKGVAKSAEYRAQLGIPLFLKDAVIGVLIASRAQPGLFSESRIALLRMFADQAVIAIENVRLFTELQEKNLELTQAHAQVSGALEQQQATSGILEVMSRSSDNVQPVFEAIVNTAARLLRTDGGIITRVVGELIELAAFTSSDPAADAALKAAFPVTAHSTGSMTAIPVRTREPFMSADFATDARLDEVTRARLRGRGFRSGVAVPLLQEDVCIGALSVTRRDPGVFTPEEVALLQTFANQAVIAIENVRLFTELQARNRALTEALEQQTATAEILRVISSSPTDLRPVLQTIAENAVRLCAALNATVLLVENGALRVEAHDGPLEVDPIGDRRPLTRGSASGRAVLEARAVHIPDVLRADAENFPVTIGAARRLGHRTVLAVPLVREGVAIGVLFMRRAEPRPFSDKEIALLETFADQAVIAIENVRLFTELEARTQELTRSVDQLTALGEVGRAVSSTLDLETVLTTIVSRAVELSALDGGVVFEYDEAAEEFEQRASTGQEATAEARRRARIRKGEGVVGRTAIVSEPVHVPDITREGAYESRLRESLVESGVRALLAVPMLREGHLIGSLVVARNTPGDFPAETVALLRTFATQSALAIQNARLFREIADKSRQLELASQHKSEFLANMSHELRTPLNAIIGFSEVLTERMFGDLNDKQEEYLKDIYASGTHLLSLINDILDLSKIEAGRMELELTDFDLPLAIGNALTLVRERAGRHGIALHHEVDARLGQIRGDERKLKQVLLNLLSNAIKFTPEGGRIDVRAALVDGLAEVSVADTGVGIAPEDQEAIFEEFRQVGTAAKKVEGTGLGLTLSRKFVELHGGRIRVKSRVGAGSTFTFTLPPRP